MRASRTALWVADSVGLRTLEALQSSLQAAAAKEHGGSAKLVWEGRRELARVGWEAGPAQRRRVGVKATRAGELEWSCRGPGATEATRLTLQEGESAWEALRRALVEG